MADEYFGSFKDSNLLHIGFPNYEFSYLITLNTIPIKNRI